MQLELRKFLLSFTGLAILAVFPFSGSEAAPGKKTARPSKGSKAALRTPSAEEIKKGMALYKAQDCAACHSIAGQGCADGVPLDGIGKRRSVQFLSAQLKDPEAHVSKNKQAFGGDPVNLMPTPDLEPHQVTLIVKYLQSLK